jgi:hypothetical protein
VHCCADGIGVVRGCSPPGARASVQNSRFALLPLRRARSANGQVLPNHSRCGCDLLRELRGSLLLRKQRFCCGPTTAVPPLNGQRAIVAQSSIAIRPADDGCEHRPMTANEATETHWAIIARQEQRGNKNNARLDANWWLPPLSPLRSRVLRRLTCATGSLCMNVYRAQRNATSGHPR